MCLIHALPNQPAILTFAQFNERKKKIIQSGTHRAEHTDTCGQHTCIGYAPLCDNLQSKHFSINHLHSQFNRWNAIHSIHFSSASGLDEV